MKVYKDANGDRRTPADYGVTWLSGEKVSNLGLTEVTEDYFKIPECPAIYTTTYDSTPYTIQLPNNCFTYISSSKTWVLNKENAVNYINSKCSAKILSKEKYFASITTTSMYTTEEINDIVTKIKADKLSYVLSAKSEIEAILNG